MGLPVHHPTWQVRDYRQVETPVFRGQRLQSCPATALQAKMRLQGIGMAEMIKYKLTDLDDSERGDLAGNALLG